MSNTEPRVETSTNNITETIQTIINATQELTVVNETYITSLCNIYSPTIADGFHEINNNLRETESAMQETCNAGDLLKDAFKKLSSVFTDYFSISQLGDYFKNALADLKEIDSILSEIRKTDVLSSSQLKDLEDNSFDIANKYGKKAADYLTLVQEMAGAGYSNSAEMAELSMLAQTAGNMEAALANEYLTMTDAAYDLKGSLEKLNKVLDGQSFIAHKSGLSMSDLAEATMLAASQSAKSCVTIEEVTATVATMMAVTGESADSVASAWNTILTKLQQIAAQTKNGAFTDTTPLTEFEKACLSLGVSLKSVKNGIVELRNPMVILNDLATAYSSLGTADQRKINLIDAVGDENAGNQLNGLLENWNLYTKMLAEYSQGSGNAMKEAAKNSSDWESSLNRLSNTWTDMVHKVINSGDITSGINVLNELLNVIKNLSDVLGPLATIGIGAGLFANLKNIGRAKNSRPSHPICRSSYRF